MESQRNGAVIRDDGRQSRGVAGHLRFETDGLVNDEGDGRGRQNEGAGQKDQPPEALFDAVLLPSHGVTW